MMRDGVRFVSVVGLMVMLTLLIGCNNAEEVTVEEERVMPVAVERVGFGSLSGSSQLSGTIEAFEDVDVTPKVSGELVEISVKKGDTVKAGQVIAKMDNSSEKNALDQEMTRLRQAQGGLQKAQLGKENAQKNYSQAQAQLRQAEAGLAEVHEGKQQNLDSIKYKIESAKSAWDEAKKSLERTTALHEDGLVSDQDYESAVNAEDRARISYEEAKLSETHAGSNSGVNSAQASVDQAQIGVQIAQSSISEAELGMKDATIAVEQAELSVEAAQDRLDDKSIIAPVSGEIVSIEAFVGEMASPQAAFANIIQLDRVKLVVNATVEQLVLFEEGQTVDVAINRLDEHLTGKVAYISASSEGSGLFKVEVELENSDRKLRSGMFGSIVVEEVLAEEGLIIPTDAIVEQKGETYVFVVEDGKAVQKYIEVNRFDTNYSSVTGDLKEDDQIIVKGQNLLDDGHAVEVKEEGTE